LQALACAAPRKASARPERRSRRGRWRPPSDVRVSSACLARPRRDDILLRAMDVVIIGGGFAGLYAARKLRRAPVRGTLVDRRHPHLSQPLLYQVASAALNPSDIAIPIRRVLRRQKNAEVMLADAVAIDVPRHRVHLADGELKYDKLIVATGATHSYFGHDEWEPYAPGLKTLEDAVNMRRRILLAYE